LIIVSLLSAIPLEIAGVTRFRIVASSWASKATVSSFDASFFSWASSSDKSSSFN